MNEDQLKFAPDIPITITLKFSQPKTGISQYGEWYLYGCLCGEVESSFFASAGLNARLAGLGELKGRTLTINKKMVAEDQVEWEISENGQLLNITPIFPESSPANNVEQRLAVIEQKLGINQPTPRPSPQEIPTVQPAQPAQQIIPQVPDAPANTPVQEADTTPDIPPAKANAVEEILEPQEIKVGDISF